LIESKISPPGVFSISDDVVKTIHATGDGVDNQLLLKLRKSFASHAHFSTNANGFTIRHYAGDVDVIEILNIE
jgi:myosin heavy subunit